MTENTFALLVLNRLKLKEAQLPKPLLITYIPTVMQTLANRVADPQFGFPQYKRELLRKTFTVAVVTGVGPLATPMAAAEPLMAEFARGWIVTGPDTRYAYTAKADESSLACDQPLGLGAFTLRQTDLLVVNSLGSRVYTAGFSVRAPFVPLLANLPSTLEDDCINVGVEVVQNAMPKQPEMEPEG